MSVMSLEPDAWFDGANGRFAIETNGQTYLHSRHFTAWRWEEQLASYYGEVEAEDIQTNVGRMLAAQNRDKWKEQSTGFMVAACTEVAP